MENVEWVNFLKLRGSAGIINVDNLPGDEVWSYYAQQYGTSGGTYPFDSGWNSSFGRSYLERVATTGAMKRPINTMLVWMRNFSDVWM